MTEYKTIYLKKGKEDSLTRKQPWIFCGVISRCDDNMEEGEVVRVISGKGDFIAIGHWQIGSIAIRVLSFDDVAIDGEFYENKLSIALDVRKSIGLLRGGNYIDEKNINTTYRLVHRQRRRRYEPVGTEKLRCNGPHSHEGPDLFLECFRGSIHSAV